VSALIEIVLFILQHCSCNWLLVIKCTWHEFVLCPYCWRFSFSHWNTKFCSHPCIIICIWELW